LSNRYLTKSKNLIKKILKDVNKLNSLVNEYTTIGKTPALPWRAFVNLADSLFLTGYFKESEELLNNAILFASNSSDALVNLGAIKQSAGNIGEAIKFYIDAVKKDSKNIKALCLWGNCLSIEGKNNQAVAKYKQALKVEPKAADIYLSWGILLLRQGKYTEAKEKLEFSVQYNLKDARSLYMLSVVEIEVGEYDEALEKLMFIIESTENNFEAYHNIAYIYFKKKDYDKAIAYAQQSLGIFQQKIETYLLLGDTFAILNKEEESLSFYEKAEQNDLKTFFLYLSWGTTLQKFGRYEESIEKLNIATELLTKQVSDELYARIAKSYYEIGDIDSAKVNISKALEIREENLIANETLADIYIKDNDYTSAIKVLNNCVKITENKAQNLAKIARCYSEISELKKSNEYYEKSLEYGESIDLRIEYIKSLYNQQEYDKALRKLRTIEAQAGDDFGFLSLVFLVNYNIAKENLYIYNVEKAISVAEKIKEKYPEDFSFASEYIELTNILRNQ